jgi:hypothetical protein
MSSVIFSASNRDASQIMKIPDDCREERLRGRSPKNLRSPEFCALTHSPRPVARYRPLPTSVPCPVPCETQQSAIFNQLG